MVVGCSVGKATDPTSGIAALDYQRVQIFEIEETNTHFLGSTQRD